MLISEFLIDENASMIDGMKQLDKVAKKVLFVVRKGSFVAAITDGDIRRWILKKGNLEAKIKNIANYSPKFLSEEDRAKAKDFMKKHYIEALPILDTDNNIISVILWNDEEVKPK